MIAPDALRALRDQWMKAAEGGQRAANDLRRVSDHNAAAYERGKADARQFCAESLTALLDAETPLPVRPQSMNVISKNSILERLRRGRKARAQFVESHLAKGLAYQIRATRDARGWTQGELAERVGTTPQAISRLESPDYGKPTLTTLKRLAAVFDIGLIVRFVPFCEMADWVSGTPRIDRGLARRALVVPRTHRND